MTSQRVNPAGLAPPRGFSHAVVTDHHRTVYLAGQTALDAQGKLVGDGVTEQFEQALGNLLAVLAASGGTAGDLVTVTIYVVDIDDYRAHSRQIGAVWRRLAGATYPAMAAIGVSRLWDAGALVEIQAVAALP